MVASCPGINFPALMIDFSKDMKAYDLFPLFSHQSKQNSRFMAYLLFVVSSYPPTLQGKPFLGMQQKGDARTPLVNHLPPSTPGSPPHPHRVPDLNWWKKKSNEEIQKLNLMLTVTVPSHTYPRFSMPPLLHSYWLQSMHGVRHNHKPALPWELQLLYFWISFKNVPSDF